MRRKSRQAGGGSPFIETFESAVPSAPRTVRSVPSAASKPCRSTWAPPSTPTVPSGPPWWMCAACSTRGRSWGRNGSPWGTGLRELHPLEDLADPGPGVGPRHAAEAPRDPEVLPPREGIVGGGAPEDQPELPSHRYPLLRDVEACDLGPPASRAQQGREHRHRRGLPRAVGSEEPVDFRVVDRERDVSHGVHAARERLAQSLGHDGVLHARPMPAASRGPDAPDVGTRRGRLR